MYSFHGQCLLGQVHIEARSVMQKVMAACHSDMCRGLAELACFHYSGKYETLTEAEILPKFGGTIEGV